MTNILIGKTITKIKIASDKKAILFACEEGEYIARTQAECCSDTWIEQVELPALGFPCKVAECCDLIMNPTGDHDHGYYDERYYVESNSGDLCIKKYGFKITTNKGEIILDYRNESNGYYGGELYFPGDEPNWDMSDSYSNNEWIDVEDADK